jgi:transcriptional regulator with XRE-family HTH domain
MTETIGRIPEERLHEYWLIVLHDVLGELQRGARRAEADGINQEVIAARLGRSPSFVSRCLRGKQNMTLRTMNNIARAMDCRLAISLQHLADLRPSNRGALYLDQPLPRVRANGDDQGTRTNDAADFTFAPATV